MADTFFLTTAIDYTNGAPHIGHAYEKILADVMARYHRLRGQSVYFLTGVDQHGQKVQQSAEKEGVPPQEFADRITGLFLQLWQKVGVEYDGWAATTDARHKLCVQKTLQRLHDEGQLYKQSYKGFYSVRQEQYLTDKERGPDGEFGPEWGQVEEREEETWYFKIAQHRDWLLALLDKRE
ncbi:MAG: methionine--tRNA ligase, partial [Verrucomicrobiaceae bacterium]